MASTGERFCRVGEIDLCYEAFGNPADEAMLLVMGLGTQMVAWRDELCELLVARGFHVIRFDNRDVGRSTHLGPGRRPTLGQMLRRDRRVAAYTLDDLAGDAAGLLDHLDIARAHLVGASMGGMIAQTMAVRHPDRVRSLASIMSTTGSRFVGQPALPVQLMFLREAARDREGYIDGAVRLFRKIGTPGFDEKEFRELVALMWDRGVTAAGTGRQLMAVLASGDRTADLRGIRVPTVVIHGSRDRMIGRSGGRATARAISGARLEIISGMGHDLPRWAWPRIVDLVADNAARAGADVARAA